MAKKSKKPSKKKATKKTKKKAGKKKVAKKATKRAATKKKPGKKAPKKKIKAVAKKAAKKTKPKAAKKPAAAKAPKAAKATVAAKSSTSSGHPLVGTQLPALTLTNQDGNAVELSSLTAGSSKVVLYFYPKDDTPGCTAEACGFRDNMNRVQGAGVTVVGVSPDDGESHRKFIEKYGLNFDLLTDADHKLAEAMNVWKEKNFMGRNYMGIERSTFLIKDGKIVKAWQPVKVEGHVEEVLGAAETL